MKHFLLDVSLLSHTLKHFPLCALVLGFRLYLQLGDLLLSELFQLIQ